MILTKPELLYDADFETRPEFDSGMVDDNGNPVMVPGSPWEWRLGGSLAELDPFCVNSSDQHVREALLGDEARCSDAPNRRGIGRCWKASLIMGGDFYSSPIDNLVLWPCMGPVQHDWYCRRDEGHLDECSALADDVPLLRYVTYQGHATPASVRHSIEMGLGVERCEVIGPPDLEPGHVLLRVHVHAGMLGAGFNERVCVAAREALPVGVRWDVEYVAVPAVPAQESGLGSPG